MERSTGQTGPFDRARRFTRGAAVLATLALGAVTLAPAAGAANATPADSAAARDLIRDTTARLFEALKEARTASEADAPAILAALVEGILTPRIDMDFIARLVLGKHEGDATPVQVAQFTAELKTLLLRTYASIVSEHSSAEMELLPESTVQDGPYAVVRTRLRPRSGSNMEVHYRLRERDGQWKVFDIIVEGVSLVTTYRRNFADEIRRSGIDGLVQALVAKNARSS